MPKLFEVEEYPNFYHIPSRPGYAINKTGDLLNLNSGKFCKWNILPRDGSRTNGYFVNKVGRRHRLLAEVFIDVPADIKHKKIVVNHINGIPGDDRLENLEWCSYSQNTQHAYDNNLHPDKVVPVVVKDFRDGLEYHFDNIQKAVDYTGIPGPSVRSRLRRQNGCRYGDFAIKTDDGSDWPKHYIKNTQVDIPVVLNDVFTNKKYIVNNAVEAATIAKCSQAGVSKSLRKQSNRPINGFVFRYLEYHEFIVWPEFTDFQLEIIKETPFYPCCGFIVTNDQTGEVLKLPSVKKATEALDCNKIAIDNYSRRDKKLYGKYWIKKVKIHS